jgi:hypothetical protein
MPDVDMTSDVNGTEVLEEAFTYQRSFLCEDTRVSAEAGPVTDG